jgi:TolB-like protein/Tfp pilus assembly protein PilF
VGLEVWFDQNELQGGDAWDASIRKQIKDCALFVPVISANTNARSEGYFRLEWKLAVDRSYLIADDQAFLVPVVIDEVPDADARVPEKFREVQWTRVPAAAAQAAFAELVKGLLSGGGIALSPAARRVAAQLVKVPSHEPPSIAVLPFVNRSRDAEDEYFSDGLADELLTVLTKIHGLRVAARSSAFTFKGKDATAAEIGRALNVATVLEGSVRKSGDRLRIAVQLVKVADGYHLWSESYDRSLNDIFAVQDDIAQSVVNELRNTLLGDAITEPAATAVAAEVATAVKGRATDPEAHRLYLQARFLLDRSNRGDTAQGIAHLKQALEQDPEFALAWAELSRAYTLEADLAYVLPADGYGRAREAVARALELEPELAEGHTALGWIQMSHDWDWRGAEASYARALDLAPGNAVVLRRAAALAMNLGRFDEAIGLNRRSIEQDPLSAVAYGNLGIVFDAAGQIVEAEQAFREALELAPQRAVIRAMLALNLSDQNRGEEALSEALREPDELYRLCALAIVHHTAGRRSEADAALRELITRYADVGAYGIATVYSARGETDLAFEWLERTYTERGPGLAEIRSAPLLRPLHADPRWIALLRKMGLAG